MLVVEPTNHRFEDASQVSGTLDEHLLERISLLENNLSRVIDKLEKTLDLMLRQAQTSHASHGLLDALISTLAETGALNRQLFRAKWGESGGPPVPEPEGAARLRALIAGEYAGPEGEAFGRAVARGIELIAAGKLSAAGAALEAATRLDAVNAPLNQLTGRMLLAAGRPARALVYLKRAAKSVPEDTRLKALLGLALAETGEAARASSLLDEAQSAGVSSFALHFGLGRLAAARGDWREARSQFKRAAGLRAGAEIFYLLGEAHHRLAKPREAAGYLRRAVGLEAEYADAWRLLGRVLAARGDEAGAKRARASARQARAHEESSPVAAKAVGTSGAGRGRQAGSGGRFRRLLTGGDARLLRALAEDLLGEAGLA
jgi:tetratricopeptide (TPR) repeat protein